MQSQVSLETGTVKSYEQNQMDTVLRVCPDCQRRFYMRPWHTRCVECRGWPHRGISR